MEQRTAEWLDKDKVNTEYHERQFLEPYRSTIAFCDWLETELLMSPESELRVVDLCSGTGANIYHLSKRYPKSTFVGVDINPDNVERGNAFFQSRGIGECRLEVGDIYNLDPKYVSEFDGVVSFQSLMALPKGEGPLRAMAKLAPQWIALTSLFYDGPVSCTIDITEYDAGLEPNRSGFYNVYSLPVTRKHMQANGYGDFRFTPFEIDVDLPKYREGLMSTFTEKLEDGRRLQISGPLLMPWYFIAATR
ncbi:MAG TPA: class I SAM-dependent methyltransferase [Gemmatimonadaceae bacterium]|nr:class I SAM-dependent methyltransferase [Gemmatimonadaceae bacterium]